ncbi:MAG: c-type cytochrome [Salinarimonas sp.]
MAGSVCKPAHSPLPLRLGASLAAAGFALALAVAPAQATEEGDIERGEAAYEANCASCHANAARITARVEGADDAEKTEALEAFLPDHYAEDDQERADIIAYMLSL